MSSGSTALHLLLLLLLLSLGPCMTAMAQLLMGRS